MANFNSINRAAAFNPTSAFPLDARCYFEDLNDAIAAAESAEAAGSSNTVYYYGQNLVVVDFEKKTTQYYVIEQDNTLKALGQALLTEAELTTMLKAILVDDDGNKLLDDNGKVQLKTINGESIIGSGNITITSEGKITVDGELSVESENPVQNKVINNKFESLNDVYDSKGSAAAAESAAKGYVDNIVEAYLTGEGAADTIDTLNEIADYIYKLTSIYNKFYSEHKVLVEENKDLQESWLVLTNVIYKVNMLLLDVLGIKVPNKM